VISRDLEITSPHLLGTARAAFINKVVGGLWLILPALCAGASVWYATAVRLGVSLDSVIYLDAANRLARQFVYSAYQHGVVKPVSHYPPLLPLVLAAFPGDRLAVARWLNILLFSCLAASVSWTVRQISGRISAAFIAGMLIVLTNDLFEVHVFLLSEPLYLICQIIFFWGLARYLHTSDPRHLWSAAVPAALAPLIRFPGVVLIGVGCLVLIMFDPAPRRLRRALLFAVLGGIPVAAWLVWRLVTIGNATNRELAFHPLWYAIARGAILTVAGWVAPRGPQSMVVNGIVAVAVVGLIAAGLKRLRMENGFGGSYARIALVFLLTYAVFLTVAITLFDAQSSTSPRLLVPALLAAIPVVAGVSWRGMRVLLVLLALWLTPGAISEVRWLHSHGTGYTGVRWQRIRLQQLTASIPGRIYSNLPEAVYYLTGRLALEVPSPINRWTRKPNPSFTAELASMDRAINRQNGAVIYFEFVPRSSMPRADSVARWLDAPMAEWQNQTLVISHVIR
jgi:hypothetical protein